jgi:hypothetical protein
MIVSTGLLEKLARITALGGALCALGTPALADEQSTRIKALETQLETSLQLIEKLSARVAQLERAAKAGELKNETSATAQADLPAREAPRPQESTDPVSASLVARETSVGLPLRGFADVGAIWSTAEDPVKRRGFSVGTLDIYLTPQFSDRVRALAEIAFEFEESGSGSVEMERLQVGYAVSDTLTLWGGRFHTPFGLWNTLFHHGAILQTSIFRPRFVEFEDKGGIMPVHLVGAWATGSSRLGAGKLSYDGYLTNAPSIRERRLDPNEFGHGDGNTLLGFNVGYLAQESAGGLKLGLHGFASTVKSFASSGATLGRTRLRTAGAYFGYDSDGWEAIGEYYRFANVDVPTRAKHASNAWFVHVGHAFGPLTPFVRFERAALDPNDNYFAAQQSGRSYRRFAAGALYALDSRSAIKIELNRTSETASTLLDDNSGFVPFAGGTYRRTALQYSIAF